MPFLSVQFPLGSYVACLGEGGRPGDWEAFCFLNKVKTKTAKRVTRVGLGPEFSLLAETRAGHIPPSSLTQGPHSRREKGYLEKDTVALRKAQ